jgi:two-component system chemotaxis response regulator CheB
MAVGVVLIDDPFMRVMLRNMLSDPGIQILGEVGKGPEALKLVRDKKPDVTILNLRVLGKGGMSFLTDIAREAPTRIVVISEATEEGAIAGAEALKLGAFGMVQRPAEMAPKDVKPMKDELIRTVMEAVKAPAQTDAKKPDDVKEPEWATGETAKKVIVIGASTGGPSVIRQVVSVLPEDFDASVLVVQAAGNKFTKLLMKELPGILKEGTKLNVTTLNDGDVLRKGQLAFVPIGFDLIVRNESGNIVVKKQGEGDTSLDNLMKSVAEACGPLAVGVVISGQGAEGAAGMLAIKRAGGCTIAQDPKSAAFSDMPMAAIKAKSVGEVLRADEIGMRLTTLVKLIGKRKP